ncbi:hypothetical protein RhiirA4_477983, partial [Rhizophagus irregularis]
GNKDIDELIQHSQLNAVYYKTCLEWIPYEKFQNATYITRGGFGKIYSAEWPKGHIYYWDIENQEWNRVTNYKVTLKSLDNSFEISTDFLNEIYILYIVCCHGITQDPNTKDYMVVLQYCENGNLRNFYLNNSGDIIKLYKLSKIANGLIVSNIKKWDEEVEKFNSEIRSQMWEYDAKIREKKLKNRSNENKFESIKTHPQAIYTSRLLSFKNLLEPVNSSDLSSFQVNSDGVPSVSANIISECFDCKILVNQVK